MQKNKLISIGDFFKTENTNIRILSIATLRKDCRKENANDSVQLSNRSLLKWLDDSIALVYFNNEFMRKNQNDFNNTGLIKLMDTLKSANGIIIDIRKATSSSNVLCT